MKTKWFMDSPLINIITRVSRKNCFYNCYKSIHSQTYKNINHICTYEDDDMKQFLQQFDSIKLVRVPNLKRIDGLSYTYNHHPLTDNFILPNWKFMDRKSGQEVIGYSPILVEPVKFQKENYFCYSVSETSRKSLIHCPYNSYLKIAEKEVRPGWVYYLDDDDHFIDLDFLEKMVDEINKFDEDTIHLFRIQLPTKVSPSERFWLHMMWGHPFIIHEVGGSNFMFHSKYLEYTAWDEWSGADYRTAKNLESVIKNKNFVDTIAISALNSHGEVNLKS